MITQLRIDALVIGSILCLSSISMGKEIVIIDRVSALALQGNVKQAIVLMDSLPEKALTADIEQMRSNYYRRFVADEEPQAPASSDSGAVGVLRIFQRYWRDALMMRLSEPVLESRLRSGLTSYLHQRYWIAALMPTMLVKAMIDPLYMGYLKSRGYYATGLGKTGTIFDMLVWTEQDDRDFAIDLPGGVQNVRVVFMDKFLTLGWEEFATFGRCYPGGWAKTDALYCVKKAYDTGSEDFRVSYLTHEAQHFADYARYPKLLQPDLEYRAKLAELCQTDTLKDRLIKRFIVNALDDSTQAHSFADHCVIRDLSRRLFKTDYVSDLEQWKALKPHALNATARELLLANTTALDKLKDVERYIR